MAHVEIQGAKMEDLWFIDTGYSNHMSGIKKWFSDMDEMFKHWVNLGNNARMMVHGVVPRKMRTQRLRSAIARSWDGINRVATELYLFSKRERKNIDKTPKE